MSNVVDVNPAVSVDPTTLSKILSSVLTMVDTVAKNQGWTLVSTMVETLNNVLSDPTVLTLILSLFGSATNLTKDQIKSVLTLLVSSIK